MLFKLRYFCRPNPDDKYPYFYRHGSKHIVRTTRYTKSRTPRTARYTKSRVSRTSHTPRHTTPRVSRTPRTVRYTKSRVSRTFHTPRYTKSRTPRTARYTTPRVSRTSHTPRYTKSRTSHTPRYTTPRVSRTSHTPRYTKSRTSHTPRHTTPRVSRTSHTPRYTKSRTSHTSRHTTPRVSRTSRTSRTRSTSRYAAPRNSRTDRYFQPYVHRPFIKYIKLKYLNNAKGISFNKKNLFNYSTNYLLCNYTHIGLKKNLTLHSFRKALLGFYSNIAIINPALTLASLRLTLNFLLRLALTGRKACFGFFGFPENLDSTFQFKGNFYFFNCWIAGSFTNHFFAKKASVFKRRLFPFIPSSFTFFGYEPNTVVDIVHETNKLLIPSFAFIDSHVDPSHLTYWIPMNSKSGYTKIFFLNFVNSFITKSHILRKFSFVSHVFSEINRNNVTSFKIKKSELFEDFYTIRALKILSREENADLYTALYKEWILLYNEEKRRNAEIKEQRIKNFNRKFDAGFFKPKRVFS